MGVQPGAVEQSAKRTRNAKHYLNPDNTYSAQFSTGSIHYQATPGGPWLDKKQAFRAGPGTAEWISDESDVTMRTFQVGTGGSAKWWVEFKETLTGKGIQFNVPFQPTVVTNDNKLTFSDGAGGSWTYYHSRAGGKMLGSPTTTSKGPQTFQIPFVLIGGAAALVVQADGSISCGTLFTMPRAVLVGADGIRYSTSAWSISASTLTFTYDDTALPLSAYPYRVDPSTTFSITSSGDDAYANRDNSTVYPPNTASGYLDNSTVFYAARALFAGPNYRVFVGLVRWDTSSIPGYSTITAATFRAYIVTFGSVDSKNLTGEYYAWVGSTADYTDVVGTSAFSGAAVSSLTISTDNDFALSSPATNVSKTSTTSLRLHLDGGTPTGQNEVDFASFDDTTNPEPRLIVDYTHAAPSSYPKVYQSRRVAGI